MLIKPEEDAEDLHLVVGLDIFFGETLALVKFLSLVQRLNENEFANWIILPSLKCVFVMAFYEMIAVMQV